MKFLLKKKSIALILSLIFSISSITACSNENKSNPEKNVIQTQKNEDINNEQSEKKSISDTVEITDHSGRTVTIPSPENLKKVYYLSPIGFIFAYTMDPDKLAGIPYKAEPGQIKYMPKIKDLTELGGMQMGGKIDQEAIINSGA